MDFVVEPRNHILFTGDSITDCGRRNNANPPLGCGYVKLATDLMEARYPSHKLTFTNTGIGGNTVRDLTERWTEDVIKHQPDWLSIMIGINDLHRFLAGDPGLGPEHYEKNYRVLLQRVRQETNAKLVLMEPFYMRLKPEDDHQAAVLDLLPRYLEIAHGLAREFEARFVRTQSAFVSYLQHYPTDHLSQEPVHPNATGHMIIAHAWLEIMCW